MIRLETWKSSQNQEERHFFIPKEGGGYQCNKYVFGYNPKVVSLRRMGKGVYQLSFKKHG